MTTEMAIPMRLICPDCGELHVDEGEFATKLHHTHACQKCGLAWRPALLPTVGVRFLPGFKNDPPSEAAQHGWPAVIHVGPFYAGHAGALAAGADASIAEGFARYVLDIGRLDEAPAWTARQREAVRAECASIKRIVDDSESGKKRALDNIEAAWRAAAKPLQ